MALVVGGEMDKYHYDAEKTLDEFHWWYVGRRSILKNILDKYIGRIGKIKILEIGCGSGGNLGFLSKYGDLSAMELNDDARIHAKSKNICKVKYGKLPNGIPFNEKFDIICLFDVLEHIEKDDLSLQTIYKYLNKGGKVIITVPAFMFLWSKHDEMSHHKRRYKKSQINNMLRCTGFTVNYSSYFNSLLFPIILIIRLFERLINSSIRKNDLREENKIINYIFKKIFTLESMLLPSVSLPLGVSIISIGRK